MDRNESALEIYASENAAEDHVEDSIGNGLFLAPLLPLTIYSIGTFKAGRISHLASRISHLMRFVMIKFKSRSGSHEAGN